MYSTRPGIPLKEKDSSRSLFPDRYATSPEQPGFMSEGQEKHYVKALQLRGNSDHWANYVPAFFYL